MTTRAVPTAEVTSGEGAVSALPAILDELASVRPFVVATARARERAGLDHLLRDRRVAWYGDVAVNPSIESAVDCAAALASADADAVVAVGGGSTLDTAKLGRALPPDRDRAMAAIADRSRPARSLPPLVLAPTTAGSGSEVTPFATVYVDGRKSSLDGPEAAAVRAVVDPDLLATCPRPVAAACALDALSHAVESYWSVHSTPPSRSLAASAIADVVPVIEAGVDLGDAEVRRRAATAATTAGLAIGLTRTTAAHAFAYPTTIRWAVPHGLACALHLAWLMPHVARRVDETCTDVRGPGFVRRRVEELATLLGADDPASTGARLRSLIAAAGAPATLAAAGVAAGVSDMVAEACGHQRAGNLPVRLDEAAARRALVDEEAAWTATCA